MPEEKDTREPYIYIVQRNAYGTTEWFCYVVGVEPGTQKITNYSGSRLYSSDRHPFKDLTIHAYFQSKEWLAPHKEPLTGYGLSYRNVFEIDTAGAETMSKTLRKANKELDRLTLELGTCSTFGDFVVRCALAIKARGFIRAATPGSWNYDSTDHAFMSASEVKWFTNNTHAEYIRKTRPDLANAA